MKLFKILIRHCAPRDKKEAVVGWFISQDERAVMNYIDQELLFGTWSDRQEDLGQTLAIYDSNDKIIGHECYFERMLRVGGEFFDDDANYDDAYYGVTHYGWEKGIAVSDEQVATLLALGVAKII